MFVDCLSTILISVDNLTIAEFLRIYYSWLLFFLLFSTTKTSERLLCAYIYIYLYLFRRSALQLKQKKTTIIDNKNNSNIIDIDISIILSIFFLRKIEFAKSRLLIILILTSLLTSLKKAKKSQNNRVCRQLYWSYTILEFFIYN